MKTKQNENDEKKNKKIIFNAWMFWMQLFSCCCCCCVVFRQTRIELELIYRRYFQWMNDKCLNGNEHFLSSIQYVRDLLSIFPSYVIGIDGNFFSVVTGKCYNVSICSFTSELSLFQGKKLFVFFFCILFSFDKLKCRWIWKKSWTKTCKQYARRWCLYGYKIIMMIIPNGYFFLFQSLMTNRSTNFLHFFPSPTHLKFN